MAECSDESPKLAPRTAVTRGICGQPAGDCRNVEKSNGTVGKRQPSMSGSRPPSLSARQIRGRPAPPRPLGDPVLLAHVDRRRGAGQHRRIDGDDGHLAPTHPGKAGDHGIGGGQLGAAQLGLGEQADLGPGARIDEQLDPLAGGQPTGRMVAGDPVGTRPSPGPRRAGARGPAPARDLDRLRRVSCSLRHRPSNRGSRRSRKAVMPSCTSALPCSSVIASIPCPYPSSAWRLRTCLPTASASGALRAISSPILRAVAWCRRPRRPG